MADPYSKADGTHAGMDAPANSAQAVTPNDSADLANVSRALYIGGAGDLYVDMRDTGTNVALLGATAGSILPIRASRVYATGTTASSIVALY